MDFPEGDDVWFRPFVGDHRSYYSVKRAVGGCRFSHLFDGHGFGNCVAADIVHLVLDWVRMFRVDIRMATDVVSRIVLVATGSVFYRELVWRQPNALALDASGCGSLVFEYAK